ncbi:MAG: hypothetical protein U0231_19710 [Nitrospiraceae bacterium]
MEADLEKLQVEGIQLAEEVGRRVQAKRTTAEAKLARVEQRRCLTAGSGNRQPGGPGRTVHADRTARRVGRLYLEQGQFDRSIQASEEAGKGVLAQNRLVDELGRYADDELITAWKEAAQRTISGHGPIKAQAIVILQQSRPCPVPLQEREAGADLPDSVGIRGIRAKQFYGDGATLKAAIVSIANEAPGFFRSLILDYQCEIVDALSHWQAGLIPKSQQMPGLIQIRGIAVGITLNLTEVSYSTINWPPRRVASGHTRHDCLGSQNSVSLVLAELDDEENLSVSFSRHFQPLATLPAPALQDSSINAHLFTLKRMHAWRLARPSILEEATVRRARRTGRDPRNDRVWEKDHIKPQPTEIKERLGWLTVLDPHADGLAELRTFPEAVRRAKHRRGTAGNGRGAVLARRYCALHRQHQGISAALGGLHRAGWVRQVTSYKPASTLFIVASGGTIEVMSLFSHFWDVIQRTRAIEAAPSSCCCNRPGTGLEQLARERQFWRTFYQSS